MSNQITNNGGFFTSPEKKERTEKKYDVFVYGSLLSGLSLNGVVTATGTFVGTKQTKPTYTMYDLGAFPCIAKGGNTSITVEHYIVPKQTLNRLDMIESHPRMYKREKITLEDGSVGWIYIWNYYDLNNYGERIVKDGDWLAYTQSRRNL